MPITVRARLRYFSAWRSVGAWVRMWDDDANSSAALHSSSSDQLSEQGCWRSSRTCFRASALVLEEVAPLVEAEVRGDAGRAAYLVRGNEPKRELGTHLVERCEAKADDLCVLVSRQIGRFGLGETTKAVTRWNITAPVAEIRDRPLGNYAIVRTTVIFAVE